jgi:probable DNA repair protein
MSRDSLPEIKREALPDALDSGLRVVTATRRLARALHLEYARRRGTDSWLTPDILPWSAWVLEQYRALRDFGRLPHARRCLDDAQAAALWEEVLAADGTAGQLLMSARVSDGFREAWRLMHDWKLSWSELEARAGEDCRVFLRTARAYERRLRELEAVDAAQLPGLLAAALATEDAAPVAFCGFDRLVPVQQAVVDALGSCARRVVEPARQGRTRVLACADTRHELGAAVDWVRARLEAQPGARIGLVVPDLGANAALLERLLDDALVPARLWPGREHDPRPWNISLALPLAETPLVDAALRLLAFAQGPMSLAEVSRVLRSPFLAGAQAEASQRARLEAWLRGHAGEPVVPAALFAGLAGEGRAPGCPLLARGLGAALEILAQGQRRRRPSRWAVDFTAALAELGWPGETPPDSAEWQAVQAWAEALDALARLDGMTPACTLGEALLRLRRIVAERRFQPESPDVPIQVLGIPETAGMQFDALWVSGLHDGVLPASLRPCPLLPAALQREHAMPRACPETEQAFAQRLLAQLGAAAAEVCFSYPSRAGDEPLRPSPVLARLGTPEAGAHAGDGMARRIFASRQLVAVSDPRGPAVAGETRGGSRLLADQSACPFRAFALHRLHAAPIELPQAGVDPRQRGSLLHEALRMLWDGWRHRATAAATDPVARAGAIRTALRSAAARHLSGHGRGLVDIEIEAGAQVIEALLAADLERPEFEVVGCESPFDIALGPLQIRGRMDRVDRVGKDLAVIDYKTGAGNPGDWDDERPAEPQMPLYAIAQEESIAGLFYGSLKPGQVGFIGRQRAADPPPVGGRDAKILEDADWRSMLSGWRAVLTRLAQDFGAGEAAVDPLQPTRRNGSCAYCRLAMLCRRDELLRAGAIGDD